MEFFIRRFCEIFVTVVIIALTFVATLPMRQKVGFNFSTLLNNYMNRLKKINPITFLFPIILVLASNFFNVIMNYLMVSIDIPFDVRNLIDDLVYIISRSIDSTAYVFSIIVIGPVSVFVLLIDCLSGLVLSFLMSRISESYYFDLTNSLVEYWLLGLAFLTTSTLYIILVESYNVFLRLREKMTIAVVATFSIVFSMLTTIYYEINWIIATITIRELAEFFASLIYRHILYFGICSVLTAVGTFILVQINKTLQNIR